MEKVKKVLDRIFIEGLSAMAPRFVRNTDHRHDHPADWNIYGRKYRRDDLHCR